MIKKGTDKTVAIYYNRKIVHMAAGGAGALVVPYFYSLPLFPLLVGMALSLFTYIPHKTGKRLYWLASSAAVPLPWWGVIAAVISSYIERYEFGPIDDNILISLCASVVIFIGARIGPL